MVTVSLSSHKAREMGKGGRHGDLSNYVFFNCTRSFTTEEKSRHIYIGENVLHACNF